MEKTKVKILDVIEGKFDVDSVKVKLNGQDVEICFDKVDKVEKYKGKEVYLSKKGDLYIIENIFGETK